jgi:hypothetical protein
MIKPVPLSQLDGQELIPQAIINRPTSHFASQFKIPFTSGHDDFAFFEAAAVQLNDDIVFELKRYVGYPENTTTIYLPYNIRDIEYVSRLIGIIADELHIPMNWISWQRRDNPEL